MKIAISVTKDNGLESPIAKHFGRSPYFAFAEVEGEQVKAIEVLPNPYITGHAHGQVPAYIQEQGANVMLSGGMGQGAIGHFEQHGIKTATGASGTAGETIERYLKGELTEAAPCGDHDGDHHLHGQRNGQGQGRGKGQGQVAGQGKRAGTGTEPPK